MAPRLVIAGTHSGVGKTIITAGLIATLCARGLRVQPFKVGPDYIDPTYHALAAGRECRNLDTWMMTQEQMLSLFEYSTEDCDIAVVEGVMGLYDGAGYDDEAGSTAEIAKKLGATVVLVIDAAKTARSAGAVALGYQQFDRAVPLAGFIVNRAGSEQHGRGVAKAITTATGLPVFGFLTRADRLKVPERHLGLIPTKEDGAWDEFLQAAAEMIEERIDIARVLELASEHVGGSPAAGEGSQGAQQKLNDHLGLLSRAHPLSLSLEADERTVKDGNPTWAATRRPVIAVANDEAFHFTYPENLELLETAGADIAFFSPLHDESLPAHTAGIILSGGFPEIQAQELAANTAMRAAVREAGECGMPIYAECGGLMYLTETIRDLDQREHAMVGLLPGCSVMTGKLTLGYREAQAAADSWLYKQGEKMRGHEFHYSTWQDRPDRLPPAYYLRSARPDAESWTEGALSGSILASYVHVHFWSKPELAERFVAACRDGLRATLRLANSVGRDHHGHIIDAE